MNRSDRTEIRIGERQKHAFGWCLFEMDSRCRLIEGADLPGEEMHI
jgi:hypothetical protein